MSSDGATVNPHAQQDRAECSRSPGRRGAHNFLWMWSSGKMTDKVKCNNCGEVRQRTGNGDTILVPGADHDSV